MTAAYERGAVYWTALDRETGHEQAKIRPCVIVSATPINRRRPTVVVLPLTTTVEVAHPPLLVAVPSMGSAARARIEHMRSVDKSRLGQRIGRLSDEDLSEVDGAIAKVLTLG